MVVTPNSRCILLKSPLKLDNFNQITFSNAGAQFLEEHTDEIVYYHEEMDMYVWGITHFGTSWDYVLTDIELVY